MSCSTLRIRRQLNRIVSYRTPPRRRSLVDGCPVPCRTGPRAPRDTWTRDSANGHGSREEDHIHIAGAERSQRRREQTRICSLRGCVKYHTLSLARIRPGCDPPPLGVSKRSIVELSEKDQQIALAEYSRLVVLFLVLGQYLTQLWQVKGQIFGKSMIFQLHESISATLSTVAAWHLHQRVPRSILHRLRCFDASRLNS